MITRKELEQYLKDLLKPQEFSDYGPNGLQIEGKEQINKIAFAVSATKASVLEAVKQKADALIVHHGLFWKFHVARPITGPFAKRIIPLIENKINLFGYHLPLDAHPEVGNAACIAKKLNLTNWEEFGDYKKMPLGVSGLLSTPLSVMALQKKLEEILNHQVIVSSEDHHQLIHTLGIITGGASGMWTACLETSREDGHKIDAYLTGEISEHDWNDAQEHGVHLFAGGHYATEQFGVQALQHNLQEKFQVECIFIPSNNPA